MTSDVATALTSWTIASQRARKVGPLAIFTISATYSGSTITASSTGGVSGSGTDMFTLKSAWMSQSAGEFQPINLTNKWNTGRAMWGGVIKLDGTISIQSGIPALTIESGDTLIAKAIYELDS